MPERNPTATESRDKIEKRRRALIGTHLTQLATAIGQTVSAERVALYCRGLNNIGETQLQYAFEQALQHLGEFLPSIQQLRTYAERWRPCDPIQDSRHLLDRGDKPPDWEPFTPRELAQMKAEAAARYQKLEKAVSTESAKAEMPKAVLDFAAADLRRRRQLEDFRRHNNLAGEA